ncbi:MAG TPA: Spo0B domain-containing protein [Bacilli bacterium]
MEKKKRQMNQLIALGVAAAGLALTVFLPWWVYRLAAAVMFICGMLVWRRLGQKRSENDWKNRAEAIHHEWLGILNQFRHDWMNDLQVLYGYAQLKKTDSVLSAILHARDKLAIDGNISRIGIPSLVSGLFALRVKQSPLKLDISLAEDVNLSELPLAGEKIRGVMSGVVTAFCEHAAAVSTPPGNLRLYINVDERHLILDFAYTGGYDGAELANRLERTIKQAGGNLESSRDFRDGGANVELRIPFSA